MTMIFNGLFTGLLFLLFGCQFAHASVANSIPDLHGQSHNRKQDFNWDRPKYAPAPPERRPNRILFPHETTCRKITHVTFDTDNPQLAYTLFGGIIQQAVNKCLGVEGVRLFSRTLQSALIAKGYITSLIDIPPQPSDSPVLQLILVWENPETSLSFCRFSAPTQG